MMHGPAPPCPPAPPPSPPLGPPPFPTSRAVPNDVPPRAPPDPADPPVDGGPHIPLAAQGAPRFKQARLDSPPILLAPWPSPPPQPSPLQTFHRSRLLAPSSPPPPSHSIARSSLPRLAISPPRPSPSPPLQPLLAQTSRRPRLLASSSARFPHSLVIHILSRPLPPLSRHPVPTSLASSFLPMSPSLTHSPRAPIISVLAISALSRLPSPLPPSLASRLSPD